jgi:hypothetical protein
LSPGYRGRPPRSQLVRAERGNPVEVRPVRVGKPTVRRAQSLAGRRMTEKRMPVAERRRETTTTMPVLQPVVVDNRPDTEPVCSIARAG